METKSLTVGFVGAGNMAEAIIRGLIDRKVVTPDQLIVSDPSPDRRNLLASQFGVQCVENNRDVVSFSKVVILAVKPQVMKTALEPVADDFRLDQLVISIAAGIRTETIDAYCRHKPAIIRIMPNTPALVGKGVSALCLGPRAGLEHVSIAEQLFASVGSTLRVDESAMDAVTAISGSGPAYVFYWMESMLTAATALGFDPAMARQLVYETLSGAAALAHASQEPPEVLRAKVTSKGGTTEAAITTLEQHRVRDHIMEAVFAAARRSKELSQPGK
jgi:pyrroline-5-carboxylate reductase